MTRDEIISAHPLMQFLTSYGYELWPAGKNFVTNACPVTTHKKYHRPVTIDVEKRIWYCNDCKVGGSVIDWKMHEKNIGAADAMQILDGGRNEANPPKARRLIDATYDYTDEAGKLLFQCVRYLPKDFRQRRPDGNGGWIWNLQGISLVLYHLPDVVAAQTVCVTEGEKDADNLRSLGFVVTCNPMGAGKWRDEYSETLRGKDVIVFGDVGDADEAGEEHTAQVIQSLSGAKSIKRVKLPDGFHDVSDYIGSLPKGRAPDAIAKLIDKTPEVEAHSLGVTERESAELPQPPAPYVPPPLDLLPPVLQDYVHAEAESLNVDVAFILLPLLSSLGAAIGNSCSIILKRGFIQPPVIWTGIIGRSGSRKSPALQAGCFAIMEHERELMQENKKRREQYDNEFAEWKNKKTKERPASPAVLTCVADDLTIEALGELLVVNPRGLLVHKDELSHWLASFDQYRPHSKGSDVARWLSLHTAAFLAVDRKQDKQHLRIGHPRVCITGGIQPKVFQKILTPDYFERGLPARFVFAHPPFRPDKWSEATVPENIRNAVLELFAELWLLQPEREGEKIQPALLRLDADAKAAFVAFYNETGDASASADERAEAAWCKLSGYAARLALVGQLARDPQSETITSDTMQAACDLARWFGNEAVRIYAQLAETQGQRDLRELCEWIERRGIDVSVRDVTHYCWAFKGQTDKVEQMFNALVKEGRAKWLEPKEGGRGQPALKIQLLPRSPSPVIPVSRGETPISGDGDALGPKKITPLAEPNTEAVSGELDAMPAGILEL